MWITRLTEINERKESKMYKSQADFEKSLIMVDPADLDQVAEEGMVALPSCSICGAELDEVDELGALCVTCGRDW